MADKQWKFYLTDAFAMALVAFTFGYGRTDMAFMYVCGYTLARFINYK